MKVIVRKASESDLKSIYGMVKELAIFENEPQEPSVTFESFCSDFGKLYHSYVALLDDELVGIALYYWGYSTWKGKMLYLDDLVVKEKVRKNKVGSQLFNAIMQIAKDENAGQVRWQVLDWNQPAIKMYEKVNAKFLTDWWTCKLEKEDILNYKSI